MGSIHGWHLLRLRKFATLTVIVDIPLAAKLPVARICRFYNVDSFLRGESTDKQKTVATRLIG